jgi:hypothetical protein
VFILSYCFAIQGRFFQLLSRTLDINVLKILLILVLSSLSVFLGLLMAYSVFYTTFPLPASNSVCVRLTQLPRQFRDWKLYVWILDCIMFIGIGYVTTVATYFELIIDYFEEQYAGYAQLHDPSGLSDADLRTLKARQVPSKLLGLTCGICLSDIEVRPTQLEELVLPLSQCRHLFHSGCILEWLAAKPVCPLCKAEIRP